jgi:hypothetical protein
MRQFNAAMKVVIFFKGLPGLGKEPGIFCFHLFSHSTTLPLGHSGSPFCNFVIAMNLEAHIDRGRQACLPVYY